MWELNIFVPPGGWIVTDSGRFYSVFEQPGELGGSGGNGMSRLNCGAKVASSPKSRRGQQVSDQVLFCRHPAEYELDIHNSFTSCNGIIALPFIDDFCNPWKTAVLSVWRTTLRPAISVFQERKAVKTADVIPTVMTRYWVGVGGIPGESFPLLRERIIGRL